MITFLQVSRESNNHLRRKGHVVIPAAAIGGLSLVLASGLALLGVLDRANAGIASFLSRGGMETFPKQLPDWSIWLVTVVFAFGMAYAILETPGLWRRGILWITAIVLVAAWAPVLSLAAHAPEVAAPWIATLWSGVCAIVYSANHRMPCDPSSASRP